MIGPTCQRAATFDRLPELQQLIRKARGRPIAVPAYQLDRMDVHYEAGNGQGPAIAVAALVRKEDRPTAWIGIVTNSVVPLAFALA